MTQRIKNLIKEKPYCKILLYFIFYLAGFLILEQTITAKYIIYCPLDDYIPFCEWFLIPYASWFILLIGAPIYFLMTDKRDFLKLTFIMFNGMTICLILYAVFPNGLNLRTEVTGTNILCQIAKLIYTVDTPTNVCPSIHVASSIAVNITVQHSVRLKKRTHLRIAVFLWTALISISTVFVKQHSVIDVLCGILLSILLGLIAYSPWMEKHSPFKTNA